MVDYEVLDKDGEEACLLLRGDLVGEVPSEALERDLERHYVDDGVRLICVDLSGLRMVNEDGIRILLELRKKSSARGKRLVLRRPEGQVRQKLQTMGLLGLVED